MAILFFLDFILERSLELHKFCISFVNWVLPFPLYSSSLQGFNLDVFPLATWLSGILLLRIYVPGLPKLWIDREDNSRHFSQLL